jgi:hypothetical protein
MNDSKHRRSLWKLKNICICLMCLIISKTIRFKEKVYHFSVQLLLEMFFTLVGIYHVTLKICAETHIGLHVKWPLKLSSLNEN